MGFEQLNLEDFHFIDFSAGWYPDKNKNDVPGGYFSGKGRRTQDMRNGFVDCQHVLWFNGALRKWFGYSVVNSSQVGAGANGAGLGYTDWRSELTQFSVFGTKFYENVSGTWTDRTAAITITEDSPFTFKKHIQGANRFIIGGNGVDDMIAWVGAGNNITNLSGSPHKYQSFDYYGDRWWGITPNNNYNFVYGSDLTDPTSNWNDSGILFPFKDTPFGVANADTWLAVVCQNGIGSIEGYGSDSFRKDEQVLKIGSSAHRTLIQGQYFDGSSWVSGFYMVGYSGPYFISASRQPYPLGLNMRERWNSSSGLNKQYLHRSVGVWMEDYKFYVFCVPWNGEQWPSQMFVFDAERGAIWPMPSILGADYKVRGLSVMKDANEVEWLYIQDDNGYVYKFDPDVKNYAPANATAPIQSHACSKVFDFGGYYDLREPQMYAKAVGNWAVRVYFIFDSATGGGDYGELNLNPSGDLLGSTFIIGASALVGRSYVFDDIDVSGQGQLFQFKFENYNADESFEIEELVLWMKYLRSPSLR